MELGVISLSDIQTDPATGRLRVGISTHLYPGATPEAARKVFPYYHEYLRPKTRGGRGFLVSQAPPRDSKPGDSKLARHGPPPDMPGSGKPWLAARRLVTGGSSQ